MVREYSKPRKNSSLENSILILHFQEKHSISQPKTQSNLRTRNLKPPLWRINKFQFLNCHRAEGIKLAQTLATLKSQQRGMWREVLCLGLVLALQSWYWQQQLFMSLKAALALPSQTREGCDTLRAIRWTGEVGSHLGRASEEDSTLLWK